MTGPERALSLIDAAGAREVAAEFARIIVGLFPPWFDFGPASFAVLSWKLGLHLVISGPAPPRDPTLALITTSDSRVITCAVQRTTSASGECARMDMHYTPSAAQLDRARAVLALALRRLYPDRTDHAIPAELAEQVPAGRVFPAGWAG